MAVVAPTTTAPGQLKKQVHAAKEQAHFQQAHFQQAHFQQAHLQQARFQ
jgi:uncharacterized protein YjbI with pentapeptide repeats